MSAKCHEQTLTLQCHLRFAGRIEAGLKLTAGLFALEPHVVPTPPPKPDPSLPLGHRSAKVARRDNQKPLRPTYPCEVCANLLRRLPSHLG